MPVRHHSVPSDPFPLTRSAIFCLWSSFGVADKNVRFTNYTKALGHELHKGPCHTILLFTLWSWTLRPCGLHCLHEWWSYLTVKLHPDLKKFLKNLLSNLHTRCFPGEKRKKKKRKKKKKANMWIYLSNFRQSLSFISNRISQGVPESVPILLSFLGLLAVSSSLLDSSDLFSVPVCCRSYLWSGLWVHPEVYFNLFYLLSRNGGRPSMNHSVSETGFTHTRDAVVTCFP